jgi:hypothetical protein
MNGKFFKCDCGHGGLYVSHDPDFGTEFAHFQYDISIGFIFRIKQAWLTLRGKPYTDMTILNDQELANLVDHLTEIQNLKYKKDY